MWLDLRSLWESTGGSVSLSIDTPGSITLAGQSITANDGVDLSAQGAITYAGQSATFGIGVAPTNGAITYAGQSVTFNDGVALSTNGAITFAGQSAALAIGTALAIDTAGAITFAGQSITANTGVALSTQGAITFNGQTVALDVSGSVALSIDTEGRISIVGQSIDLVAPSGEQQATGGWAFWVGYEQEQRRRRDEKRRREQLAEETEQIEEKLDRDIARLLREQEAQDARRAELDRLGDIARRHADLAEARAYSERVAAALERAIAKSTFSALEALDREIERAQTEEELVILISQTIAEDQ